MTRFILSISLALLSASHAFAQANDINARAYVYAKKCDVRAARKLADYQIGEAFKFKAREVSPSALGSYSARSNFEGAEAFSPYFPSEAELAQGNVLVVADLGNQPVKAEGKKLIFSAFSLNVTNGATSLCRTTGTGTIYHGGIIKDGGTDWAVGGQQSTNLILEGKPALSEFK